MKYAYVIRLKKSSRRLFESTGYLSSKRYVTGNPYDRFASAQVFPTLKVVVAHTLTATEEIVKVKRMPSGNYKIVEVIH